MPRLKSNTLKTTSLLLFKIEKRKVKKLEMPKSKNHRCGGLLCYLKENTVSDSITSLSSILTLFISNSSSKRFFL